MMSDPLPTPWLTGDSDALEGPRARGKGGGWVTEWGSAGAGGLHFPGGVARSSVAPGFLKGSR